MAKRAVKAPTKKTSPLVWVGLVVLCAAVYVFLAPSGPAAATSAKPKKRSAKDASEFTEADYRAAKSPFPSLTIAAVDAFNPLVKQIKVKPVTTQPAIGETPGMVPTKFAGGEPNWYYTGCPEADGTKQALLENTATGESAYLKAGQSFKGSRVQSVDVSFVSLVAKDGTSADVKIQGYGDVPGGARTALAQNAPLPIPGAALNGPIGGRIGVQATTGPQSITLSNGQTLQLPPVDGAATAPDAALTTGRRRRRNRNQNTGDPTNGF